jgi:hypothetical protein
MTYASQKAAYRARAKARGVKLPSRFETGRFVAVDGEGFADGETLSALIGKDQTPYEARDHFYALLMDSDGHEAWSPSGRLSAKACLDFLLDIPARDPNAIPVIFGGSYDVCHMLAFDLDRYCIGDLVRGSGLSERRFVDVTLGADGALADYRIEYRTRKQLSIWRWAHGADKYRRHLRRDGRMEWKLNPEARVTLWDVWGFFQGSFLAGMDAWIPEDADRKFISKWKGKRGGFDRSEIADIRRYTAAELRCLVSMMERVRTSVASLNLSISRWDGAGAIAKAMFRKNNVREHMAETPEVVFDAARIAYSGGHIEACQVGYHNGKVYHYDINSAYPHQFRRLPGLSMGRWITDHGAVPIPGFTLVHLEYHFQAGLAFYPLFYRSDNGSILYPERGSGWYWHDEYLTARDFAEQFGAYEFRVVAWHHFETNANASPFGWIEDAYAVRRDVIQRARASGVRDDSHMMIRLGLNSCYGATAQQVGARYDRETNEIVPPTYFQLEWAGFVTSGCRAQLMRAAMQKPEAVISFATDAVFCTEPLDLPCDPAKRLGEWENHCHDNGMTVVMPGVYWLHDRDEVKHFSRGWNKQDMSDPEIVHRAWKRGETSIRVKQERMITLGMSRVSEDFWRLRGLFVTTERKLMINGLNGKRYPIAMSQCAPHKELCRTWPRELPEDAGQSLDSLMSAPYPIAWLEPHGDKRGAVHALDDERASSFLVYDGWRDRDTAESAFLV